MDGGKPLPPGATYARRDADVHENMLFKCTEIKINFVCTNDGCGIDILSHGDLSYEKMPT